MKTETTSNMIGSAVCRVQSNLLPEVLVMSKDSNPLAFSLYYAVRIAYSSQHSA